MLMQEQILEIIIMRKIALEMERAAATHAPFPVGSPERSALILCEEAGEVAKEALNCTRPTGGVDPVTNLKAELYQVAAVCVMWLEHLERGE
jgi:NTP pyrophosphatase (non-canonical NTP hydrolase)